ncbi:MAG: hypothetical protein ACI9R3_002910 [Verrucomicrobiales bacterium]|jgi:hypothetical protein
MLTVKEQQRAHRHHAKNRTVWGVNATEINLLRGVDSRIGG